ncbi:glycosyltransferase [Microbacterium protaetiae]|uniref:Glycosyltransferase n=1 Tax=Microbacterium protaetiae TaxID=2509458 RepID=A0A4P6ERS8_9MICO|nr:glycosyltransferase [Microbacterium protaetiae]QAY60628.1 glycosyltransferase [Microbacterium protaetiae]
MLSVIVPVYNVEAYLPECLNSILSQSFRWLELVAVDDGSTDSSLGILAEYAAQDPRIRIVRQVNAGLGAARNTGVAHARGRLLTFVDSDDALPPHALEMMVRTVEADDAEIAVGAVSRFRDGESDLVPLWVRDIHDTPRVVSASEDPSVLRNFYTWNKVYRADFWRRERLRFREGVLFEDQPLVTRALCRATRIHVLDEVTYRWRIRSDGSSLTGGMYSYSAICERQRAIALTSEMLAEIEAPRAIMEGWQRTLAEHHIPNYLAATAPLETSNEYDAVCELTRSVLDVETVLGMNDLSASSRVMLHLALRGEQSQVAEFLEKGGRRPETACMVEYGERTYVALPFFRDETHLVPNEAYAVSAHEQRLWTAIHAVDWAEEGAVLRVSGAAGISLVPAGEITVEASIVGTAARHIGTAVLCRVVPGSADGVERPRKSARFEIDVDIARVTSEMREAVVGGVHLAVKVTQAGVTRSGPMRGEAGHAYIRRLRGSSVDDVGHGVISLSWTILHGLVLTLTDREVIARRMTSGGEPDRVRLVMTASRLVPHRVIVSSAGVAREFAVKRTGSGTYAADLDVGWLKPGAWSYIHVADDRHRHRAVYGPAIPSSEIGTAGLTQHTGTVGNLYVVRQA